jgi:kynureninase
LQDFMRLIERVLAAPAESVVPFPNATRGMAAVASALDFSGRRNGVVMTDLEFTTFYPFWRGQEREGARITIVESEDGMTVPVERLERAIDDRTRLVATCHVYFRSGAVQEISRLTAAAHAKGAQVLVDGYQAVGTVPVDVRKADVDYYVGGCHKYLCGGPGAGFLYVRPDLVRDLQPRLSGWFGLANPFGYVKDLTGSNLHEGVRKFMDGTPNVPGVYAAREGVRQVLRQGIDRIRRASLRRTRRMIQLADALGLRVRTPRDDARRGGMVCVDFPGAQRATEALVRQKVVVDWRPDCGLRASPHFYNADADVERLFDLVAAHARRGSRRAASLK